MVDLGAGLVSSRCLIASQQPLGAVCTVKLPKHLEEDHQLMCE